MAVTLGVYGATGATGWTTITQSTGKIVYVSNTDGHDSNNGLSSVANPTNIGGAGAAGPVKTLSVAKGLLTDNQSDWMLLREADTFTDQSIGYIGKSGKNAAEPMVFGSYHASQPGVLCPAVAARPVVKMNQAVEGAAGIGSLGNAPLSGNYVAVMNIEFYNYTRDPANIGAGFSATNGSMIGIAFQTEHQWLLIEGCMLRFGADNIDLDMPTALFSDNLYFRRNAVVDAWSDQGLSQGLHAVRNYSDFVIEECLFDRNGWNEELITPATATLTIASPCVVTWTSNPVFNLAKITFHSNSDTLPTGLSFATEYYVTEWGVDGTGKFRLSSGRTTATTGTSIAGTALTVGSFAIGSAFAVGDWLALDGVIGGGLAAGTRIVSGAGNNWVVSVSQTVGSSNISGYPPINTTGSQSGTHKIAWDGSGSPKITGFNHNIYTDANNAQLTFRGNIVAHGATTSFENRIGGTTTDNLFSGNSDTGFVGGSASTTTDNVVTGEQVNSFVGATNGLNQIGVANGTFSNNFMVNSTGGTVATDTRSASEQAHDDAVRFTLANPCVASFRTGVFSNGAVLRFSSDTGGTPPASIVFGTDYYVRNFNVPDGDPYDGECNLSLTPAGALISTASQSQSGLFGWEVFPRGCTVSGNTVYNWGSKATNMTVLAGNTLSGNQDYDLGDTLPVSWTDPSRSVSRYNNEVLGGTATLAAFLTSARANQKSNWNANLTAPVVNDWIRAGFGVADAGGGGGGTLPKKYIVFNM